MILLIFIIKRMAALAINLIQEGGCKMSLFLKYYVKNEDTGMIYADAFLTLTDAFQFAWSQEDKTGNTYKVYREDQI